jgi:protein-S-isoprenylcysteine O-methyltransferase Ste14
MYTDPNPARPAKQPGIVSWAPMKMLRNYFYSMELTLQIIDIAATSIGVIAIAAPVISLLFNIKRGRGRSYGGGGVFRTRPAVILSTFMLAGLGALLWIPIPCIAGNPFSTVISLFGTILYFPGVGLYLWSWRTLGSQFGVSNTFGAALYENHKLIQQGPFGIIRHPMYLGVILAACGALLIYQTVAMVFYAPMSVVVIFRARQEEKVLAAEFREEWIEYSSRVPKWLPRIRH